MLKIRGFRSSFSASGCAVSMPVMCIVTPTARATRWDGGQLSSLRCCAPVLTQLES